MSGGERYTGPRQAWALGVILSALGRTSQGHIGQL